MTINIHRGLYQYTRLPFGVTSAPAIFQDVMDTVLQGLPKVIYYLDDILISASTPEEHLDNVKQVLQRLEQCVIRARGTKCAFMCTAVEYLGHRIDSKGLHILESTVTAVVDALCPMMYKSYVPFWDSYTTMVNSYIIFQPYYIPLTNY